MTDSREHIIIIGAPGTGKGTYARKIEEAFGFQQLSTGELFRAKYAEANKKGKASIDKGGFFSTEVAYCIINDFLQEHTNAKGIIYDGFPRNMEQATYFIENICKNPIVIVLELDEKILIDRLLSRGKQSHRADDASEQIILKRMSLYQELTLPVVSFFKERQLAQTFSNKGKIEDVARDICNFITKKTKNKKLV